MLRSRAEDKPRVLVVDDEAVICDILADFLAFEGFDVTPVGSAEQALSALDREHFGFNLVLSDLKMPGMGGLNLLQRIYERETDIVTVIMTGFGTVETAIEAMKVGAFDYILKPFKPEHVVQVLKRGLEKQRLERENVALRQTVGFYELSEALSSAMPLDEQLLMIVELVRDNFGADGVWITAKDPKEPGSFLKRAAVGKADVQPELPQILSRFTNGEKIIAHGDEIPGILSSSSTAEHQVSAFMSAPLKFRGAPFGMLGAVSTQAGFRFSEGQRKGLSIFGGRAANAIETARMYGDLRNTFTETIEGFARALEAKDTYTAGHSDRVATYSKLIAQAMGLPEVEVDRISHGGLMHDIGKIGIRSDDLNKPQKLTPAEYLMFKSHPVQGRRIIEPISFLTHLVPCVYYHHESFDGTGYPEGLGGMDIPQEARILAVADSYDAMTSNRPYRKALPHDIAMAEFRRCAGKQFDPDIVDVFRSVIDDFREERQKQGLYVPE